MSNKKIDIISPKISNLNDRGKFSLYQGKKVFSKSGEYIGRVNDIILDDSSIIGVLVEGKHTLFIDKQYIRSDFEDNIILSIDPVTLAIGKIVFDLEGRKLGKVIKLKRQTTANKLVSIIVRKNFYSRSFSIPAEDISFVKRNIILNKEHKK